MSADNWTKCPNCKIKAQNQVRELESKLDTAYGKVSKEEYQTIVNQINSSSIKLEDTLREDYEIGIHKDEFFINYVGYCQVCKWSYEYKYEDKRPVK